MVRDTRKRKRQDAWLAALIAADFDERAARAKAKVAPRTLREWRENPEFMQRESDAMNAESGGDMRGRIKRNLLALSGRNPLAGKVLLEILDDEEGKSRGVTKPCMHCGMVPFADLTPDQVRDAQREKERLVEKVLKQFERIAKRTQPAVTATT